MKIKSVSRSGEIIAPKEIKITQQQARVLIKSLVEQLKGNNPTEGGAGIRDNSGGYFSISVCGNNFYGTGNVYN